MQQRARAVTLRVVVDCSNVRRAGEGVRRIRENTTKPVALESQAKASDVVRDRVHGLRFVPVAENLADIFDSVAHGVLTVNPHPQPVKLKSFAEVRCAARVALRPETKRKQGARFYVSSQKFSVQAFRQQTQTRENGVHTPAVEVRRILCAFEMFNKFMYLHTPKIRRRRLRSVNLTR